ncbi:MAG: hypothetical protein PUF55_08960, partial [Bacteroidales bacterium]|nr:hypothetical protein [Bacteroidales bacterium]
KRRISLIYNTIHKPLDSLNFLQSSKIVQIACKTAYFASSSSQSCGLTLTILLPHFDFLALQDSQDDTTVGCRHLPKAYFQVQKT